MRRLWSALLLSTLLAWARPAYAATVAIVRPPNPSSDVAVALHSLHGELLSVGLDVTLADRPAARGLAGADSRAWLEQVAAERGASAVIDIVGDDALVAVDVWVVRRRQDGSRSLELGSSRTPRTHRRGSRFAPSMPCGQAFSRSIGQHEGGATNSSQSHRQPLRPRTRPRAVASALASKWARLRS